MAWGATAWSKDETLEEEQDQSSEADASRSDGSNEGDQMDTAFLCEQLEALAQENKELKESIEKLQRISDMKPEDSISLSQLEERLETFGEAVANKTSEKCQRAFEARLSTLTTAFDEEKQRLQSEIHQLKKEVGTTSGVSTVKLSNELKGSRNANAELRKQLESSKRREDKLNEQILELELELEKHINLEQGESEEDYEDYDLDVGADAADGAPPCRYFLRGYCRNGDGCTFYHPGEDVLQFFTPDSAENKDPS